MTKRVAAAAYIDKQSRRFRRMGFMRWLCLLFIGLKLTGHIDWSWWAVLAPIWVPVAVVFAFAVLIDLVEAKTGVKLPRDDWPNGHTPNLSDN